MKFGKSIFKTFFLSLCIIANTSFAHAQTASILPNAKTTFVDQNGKPLTAGTVDFYTPGTTTRKTTWQDSAKSVPNTNPVVLDGAGRSLIWGDGSYRQIVKDRNGNLIWDQVTSSLGSGGGSGVTTIGDGLPVGTILPNSGVVTPPNYQLAYGQAVARASFPELLQALTIVASATCIGGSSVITNIADTAYISVGAVVESICVAGSPTVISKTSTSITLNLNSTISTTANITVFPYGNGDALTTFNLPDIRGYVLAGRCNMGGVDCSVLNSTYFSSNSNNTPSGLNAKGGSQSLALATANLPPQTPSGTIGAITVTSGNYVASNPGSNTLVSAGSSGSVGGVAIAGATVGLLVSNGTTTFTGTAFSGQNSTPISKVQPTETVNYIIKVTPDVNLTSTYGVAAIGGMTGIINCGANITCAGNTISGVGSAGNTPHTQDFVAPGAFTPGTTTSLTLSSAPSITDLLTITFDGIGQNANTWSLAGAIVTFSAAIPLNVQVVEAKWSTTTNIAGVSSVNSTVGALNIVGGPTTTVSTVGQNITVGNNLNIVSITDYGAKCDGIFQSNQNFDQPATNLSITSGTPNLTSSGSTFTINDVNKRIWVPGAGVAGAGLSTTILSFVDATHVTLAANASTTLSVVAATNAAPFVYGTDDTSAIQSAFNSVPRGGVVYIPGKSTGCIIRQQGANTYSLLQNKPFTIKGDGHYSNLMTFPDIPSTVDNILVDGSAGWDWTGISWTGFSIGMSPAFIPPTFLMYKRYGKRGLALVDTAAANFVGFNITNTMIGESGNDYSLYIGNAVASPSQAGNISYNKIFGGMRLAHVQDSFRIQNNFLYGASTFGGLYEFATGAAGFNFSNNNVTWAGCTIFTSGTSPSVVYNYFEEVVTASSCTNNIMVDFTGSFSTISAPIFENNIVGALVSTTATPVRFLNVNGGTFGKNTITTSTVRNGVVSTTQLSCTAPNTWNGVGSHFSTALASPNPFSC